MAGDMALRVFRTLDLAMMIKTYLFCYDAIRFDLHITRMPPNARIHAFLQQHLAFYADRIRVDRMRSWSDAMIHNIKGKVEYRVLILDAAAEQGLIPVLEWLLSHRLPIYGDAAYRAMLNGHDDVIKWMHAKRFHIPDDAICHATVINNRPMLEWFHAKGLLQKCTSSIMTDAARYGHQDLLAWFEDLGLRYASQEAYICAAAAEGNHFSLLQWLRLEKHYHWDEETTGTAALMGNMDMLKWACDMGCPMDSYVLEGAASSGRLDMIEWAMGRGISLSPIVMLEAAQQGHLNVIERMQRSGPVNPNIAQNAAAEGHLHVLRWLHAQGMVLPRTIFDHAAKNGHLAVIQWAYDRRLPSIASSTAISATEGGHLRVLRWLRDHGFPMYDNLIMDAIFWGHSDIVQWGVRHHLPHDLKKCYLECDVHHNFALKKWFRRLGASS
jgi:hypothetical protein